MQTISTEMREEMKNYRRDYPRFSLCGLNCGLCPMYHISEESHCPGCGGEGRPSCAVIRCSLEHGGIEYCCQCSEYPCVRYPEEPPLDSFVPSRNIRRDFERLSSGGTGSYKSMMDEKVEILKMLLKNYNDGRRKSFFCTAVNLLELEDCKEVVERIHREIDPEAPFKEQAAQAAGLFQAMADERGISLKLKKKK